MPRDLERIARVQSALQRAGWEALVCARPSNVLMLTGYWPVIGTSVAIATREGHVGLIVPEDERELAAKAGWDELEIIEGGSLDEITSADQRIREPLARLAKRFNLQGTCGFEHEATHEPTSYAGVHSYSGSLRELLSETIPVTLVPADDVLSRLRASLTSCELDHVRLACQIAEEAYAVGRTRTRPGLTETEVACAFRAPLARLKIGNEEVERADGFAYCMSGPNSAEAFAAYQRSRAREIQRGDLVLVHCNSWVHGYWTDITRTYACGEPDSQARSMYDAVLAARNAAFEVVKPGIKAAEVDRVVREVMRRHGLAEEFKHPTGHGVGFSAINHLARPRLHPASDDVLEPGMVFNIEPAAYFADYGGLRHCDMVVVSKTGAEVLTPFQAELDDLILRGL
ncbi:MAG TPA: Xaa-Pro peptidase family protein [Verrucomicrobiae bacterium]|nr:Xaa-Pro peptidase family protein [Verrucomicrobiae bacterium]